MKTVMKIFKRLRCLALMCAAILSESMTGQSKVADLSVYLTQHSEKPVEFALSKLKNFRVVAIGEDHWIADHTPFFCELLQRASESDDTRPDVVALEFGSELDQNTANRVAYSKIFLADSVMKILQHAPDIYGNPYKEYFDVFKCIWKINQSLPESKKVKIRLLDPAGVQDHFNHTPLQRNADRDMSMFAKIRWDFCSGKKVIFYAGQAHTQRQIRGTRLSDKPFYYNFPSAGFLLKSSYPNDVYIIDLWSPLNMGKGYEKNPLSGMWYERNNGLYDKAFKENGNVPCGFDIKDGPWADITMAEYFGIPGREGAWTSHPADANPYTCDVRLSQLIDGIVFVKPASEFRGATLMNIYTPEFMEVCRERSSGELRTPAAVMGKLREWHPMLK